MPQHQHAYDNPELNDIEFLIAVMHDPSVALAQRMDAAAFLISIGCGHLGQSPWPTLTFRVVGGLDAAKEPADDQPAAA